MFRDLIDPFGIQAGSYLCVACFARFVSSHDRFTLALA